MESCLENRPLGLEADPTLLEITHGLVLYGCEKRSPRPNLVR
jgi:hypothetical protein